MAGTMWCADALFAFAQAGAAGFHFHWGFGGRPIHGGQPNTGVQTNFFKDSNNKPYPSVHAPWYGYLLFRAATAGLDGGYSDATMVYSPTNPGACSANIKVWGLAADGGELRAALLNKDADASCNVALTLDAPYCGRPGALSRLLPGKQGLMSKDGISWRGQSYDGTANGVIQGEEVVEVVQSRPADGGKCTVIIPLPLASGAVLIVPRA